VTRRDRLALGLYLIVAALVGLAAWSFANWLGA